MPAETGLRHETEAGTDDLYSDQPVVLCAAAVVPCPPEPLSFHSDLECVPERLWDDTCGILNWNNAAILGIGLGGSLALRATVDDDIRDHTQEHPDRWGTATDIFGVAGEAYVQWPTLLGLYAWSLHSQNRELHDFTATSMSALGLTGVGTLLVKGIANTNRPDREENGGRFGFPSYHAASSFSLAAVVDEYYGPQAGIPAYLLAGLISWSRIDSRNHDLSDVVFGATLGYVIGKSVANRHLYGDGRVQLLPWHDPVQGTSGAVLETRF